MKQHEVFTARKVSQTYWIVEAGYNTFDIYISEKGIGIYLCIGDNKNTLFKSYTHNKIMTAINYLFQKEII